MSNLTPDNYAGASAYILKKGRPLDRALFRYHFESGAAAAVWEALAAFQNSDGGFGHALEPDVRTPSSSALGTGIALRILAETDAPTAHPLVQGALAFLDEELDRNTLTWRVIPRDANESPHAPWWHDADGSLSRTFDDFQIIPRAELVAFLSRFAAPGQFSWFGDVTNAAVRAVEKLPLGGGGGDDLVYAIRLAEAEGLADLYRRAVLRRVREVTPAAVTRDPQQWTSYSIPPLKLAPAPQSPVADLLGADLLARNLDFLLEQQAEDGAWDPTWSWGEFYEDTWPLAREEWRGELTLHNLLALRDYGRFAAA